MLGRTVKKSAWLVGGILFLILAIIGLLLPVIPQMPFFVASVFCFVRCSQRLNDWLSRQHGFARFHNWAERKHWFRYLKEHLPVPAHHKKHDPSDVD